MKPKLVDIEIRTDLRPGDIGAIIHMHGTLYGSEHGGRMVASMLLMHRGGDVAQLRYFLIRPVYLWTVDELPTAAALRPPPAERSLMGKTGVPGPM
jgi:hypothetical protein